MEPDIDKYLAQSIERFRIKSVGYNPQTRNPYAILDDDQIFYGLPGKKEKILQDILFSILEVVKDLEYRYFQINRKLTQHSRYQYKAGDVVVELGAYLGYYSMYAAKQVGPEGKVVSVELIPENYEILKLNLSSNFPDNTVAINCGVHKAKGVMSAFLGRNQIAGFRKDVIAQYASNIQEIEARMDTVDNILKENEIDAVDLMIIQVNGNELDVLEGMSRSIRAVRNFAIAAPYDSNGRDHKNFLSQYLHANGFVVDVDPPWVYAKNRN